jgi:hypothetical protein
VQRRAISTFSCDIARSVSRAWSGGAVKARPATDA